MKLVLGNRLSRISDFVRHDSIVADIGTDHGYLVCSLISTGKCKYGYATDINKEPLNVARKTISSMKLEDKIKTVLNDGAKDLDIYEIDDVVIAGMGGELISDIIENASWLKNNKISLILQPMTRPEYLRRYLYANGFEIVKESAVESGKYTYTVMLSKYTGEKQTISLREAFIGKLEGRTDSETINYFKKTIKWLLNKSKNPFGDKGTREEIISLRNELDGIVMNSAND